MGNDLVTASGLTLKFIDRKFESLTGPKNLHLVGIKEQRVISLSGGKVC